MGNFTRKLKRKQMVAARKQFMKDFKRSMMQFKIKSHFLSPMTMNIKAVKTELIKYPADVR